MMDERGVSSVVGYIVTLGITSILITGLLIAGGDFVQDQRETTIREELKVLGQRLSDDVSTVERIGEIGGGGDASVRRSLPTEVAGSTYSIQLTSSGGRDRLVLTSGSPSVTVTVPVALPDGTSVDGTVGGGKIVVSYDASIDEVRLDDV